MTLEEVVGFLQNIVQFRDDMHQTQEIYTAIPLLLELAHKELESVRATYADKVKQEKAALIAQIYNQLQEEALLDNENGQVSEEAKLQREVKHLEQKHSLEDQNASHALSLHVLQQLQEQHAAMQWSIKMHLDHFQQLQQYDTTLRGELEEFTASLYQKEHIGALDVSLPENI